MEFALILPVMLGLNFCIVEITQAVMVNRLVALTDMTVNNVVTQYTTLSQSNQMPDIFRAASQIMNPYPIAGIQITVTNVNIDAAGTATVAWGQCFQCAAPAAGSSAVVPAALDTPNTHLIHTVVTYSYTPITNFLHLGPFSLQSSVYMSPRNSSTVNLVP